MIYRGIFWFARIVLNHGHDGEKLDFRARTFLSGYLCYEPAVIF